MNTPLSGPLSKYNIRVGPYRPLYKGMANYHKIDRIGLANKLKLTGPNAAIHTWVIAR